MFAHRAILADVVPLSVSKEESAYRMHELSELTKTYGGIAVVHAVQRKAVPDYATFLGKGKVEELYKKAEDLKATVLIINSIVKPGQMYRLEEKFRPLKVKIWDRIDLILHIFEKHATTTEAKCEIALARLRHMGPRIVNMGDQLGRQRGGTGTRGGSGEGNTEAMKRHIKQEEQRLIARLEEYKKARTEQQKARTRKGKQTVALVGYTNAGKTSLLATLTKKQEKGENKLFATLDTRVGECYLPSAGISVLVSDTIGFIEDLPPQLIHAFAATLSEAVHADLVMHVLDISDAAYARKKQVVEDILALLGVQNHPTLLVCNKSDLLKKEEEEARKKEFPQGIFISTFTKEGVNTCKEEIARVLSPV